MTEKIPVLMTGAGAPGAPGIIHCLKQDERIRLIVADADADATGRRLHPDFIQIPRASDPGFAETLLHICSERHIRCLLPLVTRELFPLSRNKKEFEARGTQVLVSDEAAIDIANNKSACYQFLRQKGIAVPDFFVVSTIEQFVRAAFELGHPHRSFSFKPSVSNGSRGVRIVSDVLDEADLLFHHKPFQLHMTYAHALSILSARPFPELLLSHYLPGEEYSVDCLADHGKALLVVPRSRKKMIQGISVQGEFVQNENIISYCRQIIEAIGLHGNIGIQVKYGAGEKPYLLEVNPRVQGTIVAALGAGVNLPLLAVQQALGWPLPPQAMQVRWGTKFSRYWTEVFY